MRRPALHRQVTWLALVAALVSVTAACGDSGDDSGGSGAGGDSPSTTSQAPPSTRDSAEPPGDDAVVLDITIADGAVTPAGESVEATVGQPIELRVDSDAAEELHVHSNPEHAFEVQPGNGQVFTFSVQQPGQVEIETHETGVVVAELVVRP